VIIMGVDPGIASTGFGIIEIQNREKLKLVDFGMITTSPGTIQGNRLKHIYEEITRKLKEHKPDALAIEGLFHSKNLKSLVDVSEAIGVVTLAASHFNISVTKFTPLKVKSAIVGFGKADKSQVQEMIKRLLELEDLPEPHHVSDALAVAICYRNLSM
jgi:crossover junction endodeoxyribonuclease RuvC